MGIQVTAIDGMGEVTEPTPGSFETTGMNAMKHMHFSRDFLNQAGVVKDADFAVSENSPAGMSVLVAPGVAYVLNDNYADNSLTQPRFFNVTNDASEAVTINANVAGNPRYTSIFIKVDVLVSPDGSASNVATLVAVDGTAAASPTAPATPADHLRLADVYVANGAASISNSNITNRRVKADINMNYGWLSVQETWTRTGNFTFTVSGDLTTKYQKGAKVRYKDSIGGSYEYGIIISSSYSAPNTTVTLATNTDYAMAAATITDTYISYIEIPADFPRLFNFTLSGSGITVGNGTVKAFFSIVGKIVQMHFRWVFGNTSSISNGVFDLPVAASSSYQGQKNIIGNANISDASPAVGYQAFCRIESSTTGRALIVNVAGTYPTTAGITSTVPITWTTNDELICDMSYIMA